MASVTEFPAAPAERPALAPIRVGTRRSDLARIQTDIVVRALMEAFPDRQCEVHAMATMGDKNQVTALHDFGAKSLWTHELEAALAQGQLDLIVHSLKDMPTTLPPNMILGAITTRHDARDALVLSKHLMSALESATAAPSIPKDLLTAPSILASLPEGSVIGTSSVRRSAQLARLHPHLRFESVRGNIGTRLSKLDDKDGPYVAIILASAGLERMNWSARISRYLTSRGEEDREGRLFGSDESVKERREASGPPFRGVLHAVGQGALGIEIRGDDEAMQGMLAKVACVRSTLAGLAERSLMRMLEGGCSVPIGVETEWVHSSTTSRETLAMRAIVASLDGKQVAEVELTEDVGNNQEAELFGKKVAQALVENGAGPILDAIIKEREAGEASRTAEI
ncbi:porphobilinogen deaminase [Lineolata rhizophorae]|uniref:Porphobilinogen deaminase n=1 Tax=Lineolata rhizophorae TaxID=578093 RepID=A0A6A6NPM7_9PEZI|nr:porphobilinogen deaminase [Lineolata rhizophorae]